MSFDANATVGEVAAQTPEAIRIFESWRIDYCCGGRTSLADACREVGKTLEQFRQAVAEVVTLDDEVEQVPQEATLRSIATYIVQTYHVYTRQELETLQILAAKVFDVHGGRCAELRSVVKLLDELSNDMLPHMLKEEQVLFPHVERLELAEEVGSAPPVPFFGTVKNPVRMMMLEHERVGDLLEQMRVTTGDYVAPADACFSYRELYRRLATFAYQTHRHVHVENNVYFPRAVELEAKSAGDS